MQRKLLAIFLTEREAYVSSDRLIELLWGDQALKDRLGSLHFLISKLRDAIDPDRPSGSGGMRIETQFGGYVMHVSSEELDAAEFEVLTQEAATRSDPDESLGLYEAAFGLWRDTAYTEFQYDDFATSETGRLEELYRSAQEQAFKVRLDRGADATLNADLEYFCAQYPEREGAVALLMLSQYRDGRQTEALRQYQKTRRYLSESLGIDPSASLSRLEEQILLQDPALHLGEVDMMPATHTCVVVRSVTPEKIGEAVKSEGGSIAVSMGPVLLAVFRTVDSGIRAAERIRSVDRSARTSVDTGDVSFVGGRWSGTIVDRATELCGATHAGQVLVSEGSARLAQNDTGSQLELVQLGRYRLASSDAIEDVFELAGDGRAIVGHVGLARAGNLPFDVGTFIGRREEVGRLAGALKHERLVTLTGVGGCGKTRTAIHAAHGVLDHFGDGGWFVNLASARESEDVVTQMNRALGVGDMPRTEPLDALIRHIGDKSMLVVVDNCEHVIATARHVIGELVAQCPQLHLVATSREDLALRGEVVIHLPPMTTPERDMTNESSLAAVESVALFAEYAGRTHAGFAVDETSAEPVAELCRQLDGIPLAIELAASLVDVMDPREIVERLATQPTLLATAGPEVGRHASLDAALAWSVDLLSEREARLFRGLGVFRGSFDLEAVEGVAGDVESDTATHGQRALVKKSLVRQYRTDAGVRFRLLEPVKQYAIRELLRYGELEDVKRRHAQHYATRANHAGSYLHGERLGHWLALLEPDHSNFRSSVQTLVQSRDAATAVQIATDIWQFWWLRGHLTQGLAMLCDVLALASEEGFHRVGPVLLGAGRLAAKQGKAELADELLVKGLALTKEQGDEQAAASFLAALSGVRYINGDLRGSADFLEQASVLARETGEEGHHAYAVCKLSLIREALGESDDARTLADRAAPLIAEYDDDYLRCEYLLVTAELALHDGELDRAESDLNTCDEVAEAAGLSDQLAWSSYNRSKVLLSRGEAAMARELAAGALDAFVNLGESEGVVMAGRQVLVAGLDFDPGSVSEDVVRELLAQAADCYLPEVPTLELILAAVLRRAGDHQGAVASLASAREEWQRMGIAMTPQIGRLFAAEEQAISNQPGSLR